MKGQIRQSLSGYYDVRIIDGKEIRTRARGVFRKRKQKPLVGDWVSIKLEGNEGYLLQIDKRKNQLVRPPLANIDAAIIVSACIHPNFSSNLLDRQLIMLELNHIQPLLYFSKGDLLTSVERNAFEKIVKYYQQYYPAVLGGSHDFHIPYFLTSLQNKLIIVMGQTGAGKSTLLNQLNPNLKLATGEISKALSRGKHTTRKVALMDVMGNSIADTPGFSSFDLFDLTKEELPNLYPDFVIYRNQCKYRGCLHVNEPQCAVKNAVSTGKILASRYDNYLQFHKMLMEQKTKY